MTSRGLLGGAVVVARWSEGDFLRFGTIGVLVLTFASHAFAKPHYTFVLPEGYVGWIEVVFGDPDAPNLTVQGNACIIEVSESGIVRTRDVRWFDLRPSDEFLYRRSNADGSSRLVPVPHSYFLKTADDGGFQTSIKEQRGAGWFIFVGPSEIRAGVRYANIDRDSRLHMKEFGTPELGRPDPLPVPGRMTPEAQLKGRQNTH
jgi:hypothetical protein